MVYGILHKTKNPITVLDTPFNASQISMDDKMAIVMPVESPINVNGKNFNILLSIRIINYECKNQKNQ